MSGRLMRQESIDAYRDQVLGEDQESVSRDELGRQERIVYSVIVNEGPVTRQEIDRMLSDDVAKINAVCGRVRSLLDKNLVREVGVRDGRNLLDVNPDYEFPGNVEVDSGE